MEVVNYVVLVSVTLILSYVSSMMYNRTKVPDIIWLLGFGLILGPVLNLYEKELFTQLAPLMSIVALCVILFEAGINVDIESVLGTLKKSLTLHLVTFVLIVSSVGLTLRYLLPESFTPLGALLFGAMVGGTSTIAVFSVLNSVGRVITGIESSKVILTVESVISDPVCIVASITLIQMIMLPSVSMPTKALFLLGVFVVSSFIGTAVGVVWAILIDKMRGRPFIYVMTLAILFPTYALVDEFVGEGGGTLAALAFGLAITNFKYFADRLGLNYNPKIDKRRMRELHEEVTFLVKSFFFVYIGLIVTIRGSTMLVGLAVVLVSLVARYLAGTLTGVLTPLTSEELVLSRLIFVHGLPALVMSQLPLVYDPAARFFADPAIFPNIAMPTVLCTVVWGSMIAPWIAKRQLGHVAQNIGKEETVLNK